MMVFIDDPIFTEQVTKLLVVTILVVLPALVMWFYPVLILRNRIRARKAEELDVLSLALQGNEDTLAKSGILKRGEALTRSDLLTHQMFVESRWEWPIAAHVQKLIVFGLLPPLTWVFAAMIENSFF